MALWKFFTCERIEISDATADASRLVEHIEFEDLFERELWRSLTVLCLVKPEGETLPARGLYERSGTWQISINPLHSRTPLWMTLADVIAAKLLGGRAPVIQEAIRIAPLGTQAGLRPVRLLGEIEIDPERDDFFRLIVEQRAFLEHRSDLPEREREWRRRLLKVIPNSASYGITAELNATRLGASTALVMVYASR